MKHAPVLEHLDANAKFSERNSVEEYQYFNLRIQFWTLELVLELRPCPRTLGSGRALRLEFGFHGMLKGKEISNFHD